MLLAHSTPMTVELMIIRERNRLHRHRVKTLQVIVLRRTIRIPAELFLPGEIDVKRFNKAPTSYKQFLEVAKKRERKIYNEQYGSTFNSFSLGNRHDQLN